MNRKDIETAAEKLIEEFGIKETPVPVHEIAASKGCYVQHFIDDRDGRDGLSGVFMVNDNVPTIGFNYDQSKVRQRFTIAHELGHFILHYNDPKEVFVDNKPYALFRDYNSGTGSDIMEQQANAFAAALLMPQRFLVEEIKKLDIDLDLTDDESPGLAKLADKFNVSKLAMSIRLANLDSVRHSYTKRRITPFRDLDF